MVGSPISPAPDLYNISTDHEELPQILQILLAQQNPLEVLTP